MSKSARIKAQHKAKVVRPTPVKRSPIAPIVAIAGVLLAAAVAVVLVIVLTSGSGSSKAQGPLPGSTAALTLFRGIPQHGTALGRPQAPVTLRVYVDPQCPYCRDWATRTFPTVVNDFVRSGKVRVEFRGLAFVGPDSTPGLLTLLALAKQNKLFQGEALLYANQGTENSGWLSTSFLDQLVSSLPGVDPARLAQDRDGATVTAEAGKATRRPRRPA
jgi:protein-disulfide isomerase